MDSAKYTQMGLFSAPSFNMSVEIAILALSGRPLVFGDENQVFARQKLEEAMVLAAQINDSYYESDVDSFPSSPSQAVELLESIGLTVSAARLLSMPYDWRRFVVDRALSGAKFACLPKKYQTKPSYVGM